MSSADTDRDGAVSRIAITPVSIAPELESRPGDEPALSAEAAIHIGHYLADALRERGYEVVPARDTEGLLAGIARSPDLHGDASALARVAVDRLRVDALLVVELTRWSPRETRPAARSAPSQDPAPGPPPPLLPDSSEGAGTPPAPAEVGFRATLHGGSHGLLLWSGEFSERQASFFESPWRSLRYPGMGTRWLTATELARWGAKRIAKEIPGDPRRP